MKLPHAAEAVVPIRKVRDYLLALRHPAGGPKAVFFLRHGFRRDEADVLRLRLKELAVEGDVSETIPARFGTKYVVDGSVETPTGISLRLRSVWIVRVGTWVPRLVTAYPHLEEIG